MKHPSSSRYHDLQTNLKLLLSEEKQLRNQLKVIQSSKTYRLWQKYNQYKKDIKSLIINPVQFKKLLIVLLTSGPIYLINKIIISKNTQIIVNRINTEYTTWFSTNYPMPEALFKQSREFQSLSYKPLISIVLPTYNTNHRFLRECIESVVSQSYPNWQLCIADDFSSDPEIRKIIRDYARLDTRIKFVFRTNNGRISKASNSALKLSSGDYITFLDHDDFLWPNALFEVVKILNNNKYDFIFADEDKISESSSEHKLPFYKPEFSKYLLLKTNYLLHSIFISKQLMQKVGFFNSQYDGAQDWDLLLRISQQTTSIYHLPKILYSWRESCTSTASRQGVAVKDYAFTNQKYVLEAHLKQYYPKFQLKTTHVLGLWDIIDSVENRPVTINISINKNSIRKTIDSLFIITKLQPSKYLMIREIS